MTYIVQSGDTLFRIAQRFQTTVNALLELNPQITNPDLILTGQTILLSAAEPTPPTRICPLLRRGDRGSDVTRLQTLLKVARFNPGPADGIFGVKTQSALIAFQRTVREIELTTGIADFETWTALGAECVPSPVIGIVRYTVRPGESLYIIAARFSVSVQEILQANPKITNPALVIAGQVINVPAR